MDTPKELVKQWASLSDDEFNAAWMLSNAQIAQEGIGLEQFLAFARLMMYEPREGKMLEPADHHIDWIKTCIEENRVCILAPPESAKTTIISVLFTAFIVGHKPWSQSVVVSVSDKQAEDIVGSIAGYIQYHPAWKMVFPDIIPDHRRGWGYDRGFFVRRGKDPDSYADYGDWLQERGTRKDPSFIGVGYSNRAIIGKRVDGVFIVDDMMDESNTRSEAELEHAKNQFVKVISSRPTEEGRLILVGTPWREDDVYADAVATGLYKNYITPAIETYEDEDGEEAKRSYWPEVWPVERLERKRTEFGDKDFRLMYMMDLEASKGQYLREEWLHPMVESYKIDKQWPLYYGIDFAVTSHDLGLRGNKRRSYFALARIALAPFGVVVVDGLREQLSFGEAIERINSLAEIDHPKKVTVEAWGSGEMLIQQLIRETQLPIFSHRDTKDKATRFMKMARHFEAGRVRLSSASTHFLKVFKDEWVTFPSSQKTYDTLDAVYLALESAGFNVYAGEKLKEDKEREGPKVEPMAWGTPNAGMPQSRFAPKAGRRRRRIMP